MIYAIPALISWTLGFLGLRALLKGRPRPRLPLLLALGGILGIGLSGLLTFTSFLVFHKLVIPFVFALHALLLGGLAWGNKDILADAGTLKKDFDRYDLAGLLLLLLLMVPVMVQASFYPYGGWDAWSCWNLKARFLFVDGGAHWQNMFDPLLWRSNIGYPLLLPCVNTWFWCFGSAPAPAAPLITSCLITFFMAGILLWGIREFTGRLTALWAPAWLLSMSFIVKLASSQYSDLLVGTYLLAGLIGFFLFQKFRRNACLAVTVTAWGLMSFTKSEGLVLSAISMAAAAAFLFTNAADKKLVLKRFWILAAAAALAFLPSVIFQIFYAHNSQTFINGLMSADKPASPERLAAIFVFFGREFVSSKWNWFWVFCAAGFLAAGKNVFRNGLALIAVILGGYLVTLIGVYYINTFFEIVWWLGMTVNRILFALTPAILFWLFYALNSQQKTRP